MVRIHPDPPTNPEPRAFMAIGGAIAQLGERLLCKQEVTGSIPVGSTSTCPEAQDQVPLARDISSLVFFGCSLKIRKK